MEMLMEQMAVLSRQNAEAQQRLVAMEHTQHPVDTLAITNQGAESWVVEQHLSEDLYPEFKWFDVEYQAWETQYQTRIRWCIYTNIMKALPKIVWAEVMQGDVRTIYEKLISFGVENAASQVTQLLKDVAELAPKKSQMDMTTWLTEMNELWVGLTQLRQPMPLNQCRVYILDAIKGDANYKDLVTDIKRHANWTMEQIQEKLLSVAAEVNDLYPSSNNAERRSRRKANKAAKRAAAEEETKGGATVSAVNNRKTANQAQRQQAHPQDGKANAPAGGPTIDPKRREQLKREICTNFLVAGHCKNGVGCWRSHETLDALKKRLSNVAKTDSTKGGKDKRKAQQTPSAPQDGKGERRECFAFRDNGKCAFEDKCKFSHDTAPKKSNVTKRATYNAPLRAGDSVTVAPACPIKRLRHVPGMVFALAGQRFRVQLQWDEDNSPAIQQWITNAESVGVPRSMLWKLGSDDARRLTMVSRRGNDQTPANRDPFSLCAILDSGCNFMSTGNLELFKPGTLQEYDEPAETQGVGGIITHATKWGLMTMRIGGHLVDAPIDFVPGSMNTLLNASFFDDSKSYYIKLKDRCLWLHAYPAEGQAEGRLLHTFPRHVDKGVADLVSREFLQDLERDGDKMRHTLYPIPDSFFVLYNRKALPCSKEHSSTNQ